jgi:hypothetical protein
MLNKILVVFLLLISLVLIQEINCLKCYSCEFCDDPFKNSSYPLINCPTGFDYCTKTIYYSSRNAFYYYTAVRGT